MKPDTKTTIVIDGPLGSTTREYADLDALLADEDAWWADYAAQWDASPWWRRLLSRIAHALGRSVRWEERRDVDA